MPFISYMKKYGAFTLSKLYFWSVLTYVNQALNSLTLSLSEDCNSSNKIRNLVKTRYFSRSPIMAVSIGLAAGSTIIPKINIQYPVFLIGIIISVKYDLYWQSCNYFVPFSFWIIMTFLSKLLLARLYCRTLRLAAIGLYIRKELFKMFLNPLFFLNNFHR